MEATPTITQKIAPSTLRSKRKWSKIWHNLRTNPHPEKSINYAIGSASSAIFPILPSTFSSPSLPK
jgi:hypothetical protein